MIEKDYEYAVDVLERSGRGPRKALALALRHGQTDGEHHKAWVIDQMVRLLTGEGYEEWISLYEQDGEYEWYTGIAP